ncbi:hypothetical protein DFH29DRAFT_1000702 [Suillus ampliporus]|nr:hypothetical protein DFH29DRAFT_1000702 [Suillus ampliporus]
MNSHSSPQRLYSFQSLCFSEHSCSRTTPTTAPVTRHFRPHPNPNPQMLNTAQSHYMGGEDVFPTAMHLEVDYMFLDGVAESEGGADHSDLALEAAKAKWKVCEAEKHLADRIIEHQVTLLNIWCHRTEVANFHLLMVDLNVGRLHMERKKSGILTFTHIEGTAAKLKERPVAKSGVITETSHTAADEGNTLVHSTTINTTTTKQNPVAQYGLTFVGIGKENPSVSEDVGATFKLTKCPTNSTMEGVIPAKYI